MKLGFDWKGFIKVLISTLGELLIIIAAVSIGVYLTSSGSNGLPTIINFALVLVGTTLKYISR